MDNHDRRRKAVDWAPEKSWSCRPLQRIPMFAMLRDRTRLIDRARQYVGSIDPGITSQEAARFAVRAVNWANRLAAQVGDDRCAGG